jgi:hypothetical protein
MRTSRPNADQGLPPLARNQTRTLFAVSPAFYNVSSSRRPTVKREGFLPTNSNIAVVQAAFSAGDNRRAMFADSPGDVKL